MPVVRILRGVDEARRFVARSRSLTEREVSPQMLDGLARLFGEALKKRIRTVVNGPDGALYLLTDESEGLLIRVTAASETDIGEDLQRSLNGALAAKSMSIVLLLVR